MQGDPPLGSLGHGVETLTEDMVSDTLACGPDPEKHVKARDRELRPRLGV